MTRCLIRLLMTLALGVLVAPLATDAQPRGNIPLVGVLRPTSSTAPLTEAFRQGLRDLGYLEGHNIRLEYRFAEGQYERLPDLAAELVRLPVDILLSYGPNYPELFRRAATFVDKILKGAKVGELPVEQSTTLALVINLKTAQALGLTIPPTLLFQATDVIR